MIISRILKVVLYAAFIGVLLASYVDPLQQIMDRRAEIPALRSEINQLQADTADQRRLIEELNTPEGIERAAREHYGMILPGEKIYIVPEDRERP
ncbi:MAG: septum formation initiator family protein [Rubrobacteraceae bacterium]